MTLENIQFKQGVVKDGTRYTNKGGWYDSDKVRFRYGFPEKQVDGKNEAIQRFREYVEV